MPAPGSGCGARGSRRAGGAPEGELGAEHGAQTEGPGRLGEADHPVAAVVVGDGQGLEAEPGRLDGQLLGMRGAVEEAEVGVAVQLGVGHQAGVGPPLDRRRPRRGRACATRPGCRPRRRAPARPRDPGPADRRTGAARSGTRAPAGCGTTSRRLYRTSVRPARGLVIEIAPSPGAAASRGTCGDGGRRRCPRTAGRRCSRAAPAAAGRGRAPPRAARRSRGSPAGGSTRPRTRG